MKKMKLFYKKIIVKFIELAEFVKKSSQMFRLLLYATQIPKLYSTINESNIVNNAGLNDKYQE